MIAALGGTRQPATEDDAGTRRHGDAGKRQTRLRRSAVLGTSQRAGTPWLAEREGEGEKKRNI